MVDRVQLLGFARQRIRRDRVRRAVLNKIKNTCSVDSSIDVANRTGTTTAEKSVQIIDGVDVMSAATLDCLQDAMMDTSVKQETTQKAVQMAKASVSGVSLGNFSSAMNRATVQARNVSTVINDTMQSCIASSRTSTRNELGAHLAHLSGGKDTETRQEIRTSRSSGNLCQMRPVGVAMLYFQIMDQTVDQTATAHDRALTCGDHHRHRGERHRAHGQGYVAAEPPSESTVWFVVWFLVTTTSPSSAS